MARGTAGGFIKPRSVKVAYTQRRYFVLLDGVTQVDNIVRMKHAHRHEAGHLAASHCVKARSPVKDYGTLE
jgi:hypothetical protein